MRSKYLGGRTPSHGEDAAAFHRVQRVRTKVHDHLVELRRVTKHRGVGRFEAPFQMNVGGK